MINITARWLQQNKRLIIISAICVAIAASFWAGSRVPSLNDKASLGGDLVLEDPLGFEAAYPVDPGDPLMEKIFFTTVNWVLTNRQGMTFGILIAAAFMTILSLLKQRSFSSHFGNTLLGLFMGMPLGVCVNCAAPIARSLHDSGARLETTLATMISSPTLNIIVLTMLFSLMPVYMAVTKVFMTLFFLLVLVPLLSRYIFRDQLVAQNITLPGSVSYAPGTDIGCEIKIDEPGWTGAIRWVLQKYTSSLFYIIRLTVPLMLLAGIMGAVAITLFPWQEMAGLFEGSQWYMAVIGALVIAAIGLFLPVPIAFDVAIVTALLAAGIPPGYATILLFTLGIFSIYSFFIIWDAISGKVAFVLSGVLLLMGILSGVVVDLYLDWDESRQQEIFQEYNLGADNSQVSDFFFGNARAGTTQTSPVTGPPVADSQAEFYSSSPEVHVSETVLHESSAPANQLFSRQYGEEMGLVTESSMSVSYRFMAPFYRNWPVASADIDADGWVDIVFGTDVGVFLYKNIHGERFERIPVPVAGKRKDAMNVALVDLNNDSMPDLYVTSYRGGNYIIFNENGRFPPENLFELPEMGSTILNATAFGDLDLDGDIDIVAGNWTTGRWTQIPGESSRNAILWNEGNGFKVERLEGLPGETLSILISDINQDSYPDLMVGNDFWAPDFYYFGQPGGKLDLIKRRDKMFAVTTHSTMSIDSGDMDNDLDFEIYATQASGFTSSKPTKRASMLPMQSIDASCDEYGDNAWRKRCLTRVKQHEIIFRARQKRNPRICLKIDDEREKKHCLAYILLEKSTRFDNNPELCKQLRKEWEDMYYICDLGHQQVASYTNEETWKALKQIRGRNIFYMQEDGRYQESAEKLNVDITGWSWTAKFADLDNDEWQDIYVVNGHYHSQKRATKVFFKNREGKGYSNDTREAGLENYLAMSAFTYIDYDNDADLDIIAVSMDGPVWIYTNNTRGNKGIIFELDDRKGNRNGIGSRIVIHYGENGANHQIREIKASGGFLSFDAPRAHFGLGKYSVVSRVEVIWSTGEKIELGGEFKAGHKYRIMRPGA